MSEFPVLVERRIMLMLDTVLTIVILVVILEIIKAIKK